MREFIFDGKRIADETDSFVIAEIGQNHCGDIDRAKELIVAAMGCGVDAVKFQKRTNKELYTDELYNAPYIGPQSFGKTYGEHREALELDISQHSELKGYANTNGLIYFATAFDINAANELISIGIPVIKIASGDLTNTPLLRYISATGMPMILSTGGATMNDVKRAADAMMHDNFAILHCVASYPNQPHEMNLRAITSLRDEFPDQVIGLSDHYNGICMSLAAYVLGARIFEKHFTLNHTWKGTDHALSLEPKGMHDLVRDLRRMRFAMGDGVKKRLESEKGPLKKMEKGLYFRCNLSKGEEIHAKYLDIKSPSANLYPYEANKVIGMNLNKDVKAGDPVTLGVLE